MKLIGAWLIVLLVVFCCSEKKEQYAIKRLSPTKSIADLGGAKFIFGLNDLLINGDTIFFYKWR